MPEPPVAAPDHAEELRDAIADLYGNGDIRFGSDSDRARRGARAALGALLAERQQDKQRIADVEELRGRLAGWVLGGEGKFVTLSDILDELCRILDGDARAALAVEEDMANG